MFLNLLINLLTGGHLDFDDITELFEGFNDWEEEPEEVEQASKPQVDKLASQRNKQRSSEENLIPSSDTENTTEIVESTKVPVLNEPVRKRKTSKKKLRQMMLSKEILDRPVSERKYKI